MPLINNITSKLIGDRHITRRDLKDAYYNIEVLEKSGN
jgi:hypothetical protein